MKSKPAEPKNEPKAPEKVAEPKVDENKQKQLKESAAIQAAQNGSTLLPEGKERGFFHVKLEKTLFDKDTGKKLSKPYVQIFRPKDWLNFQANAKALGFTTVEVKWDPEKYLAALK